MKKRIGLGRGLDALLARDDAGHASEAIQMVSIDELVPGKYQPRQQMDTEALSALADSIRGQGLIQPILVRPIHAGQFEILAGERRWRAAKMAGLTSVSVIVRDIPDNQALMIGLIENIQREDLNAVEEAQGLNRLIEEFGMTHQEVADAVGRSRSAVTNLLRLLNLAKPVQDLLAAHRLDMGHARALLPLPVDKQIEVARLIVDRALSVRQAESCVRDVLKPVPSKAGKESQSPDVLRLRERLSDWLGAQVVIDAKAGGKGSVSIRFSSLDQLSAIFARFGFDVDADEAE